MSEHYFAFKPGDSIHEYRIDAVLGQGTFGITYAAEDTNLGEPVAIKEYLPSGYAVRDSTRTVRPIGTEDADEVFSWGLESFAREAKSLARMRQRNVVRVRRLFRDHGTAYIVMDLIDGERFDHVLRQYPSGGFPADDLRRLMCALLRGLSDVHSRGLLHRDLKPSNIIIDRAGEPIMIDFGAARDLRVTRAGGVSRIFTAEYAPYEQQTPGAEQSAASDLYALGAILYKAITGELPPHAVSRLSTDRYVRLAGNPACAAYPPHLLRLIDQLLAVEMRDRPQSADEVLRAIEEATVFVPPRAPVVRPAPRPDPRSLIFEKEPPPLDPRRSERPRGDAARPSPAARRRTSLAATFGAAAVIGVGALAIAALTLAPAGWWSPRGPSTTAERVSTAEPGMPAQREGAPSATANAESGKAEQADLTLRASKAAVDADRNGAGSASTAAAGSSSPDTAGASGDSQPERSRSAVSPPPAPKPPVVIEAKAVQAEPPPLPPPLPPRSEPAPAKIVEPAQALAKPIVEKPTPTPVRPPEPAPALASLIPEKPIPTPPPVRPSELLPALASPIREKPTPPPVRPPEPEQAVASPVPEQPTPPPVRQPEPGPALASVVPEKPTPPPIRPAEPIPTRPRPDIAANAADVPFPTRKPSPPSLAAGESFGIATLLPPAPLAKPAAPTPAAPEPPRRAAGDEREAWLRAKYAVKENEIRAFLERYPDSEFAGEAKARLATFSREALGRYNGTWRSFGPSGCPFTGVMELDQGSFTLTLKRPDSSLRVTGEINEDGAIEKIVSNPDKLVPTGRLSGMTVAPVGCRFEFALVDVTVPARKTP